MGVKNIADQRGTESPARVWQYEQGLCDLRYTRQELDDVRTLGGQYLPYIGCLVTAVGGLKGFHTVASPPSASQDKLYS